MRSNQLSYAPGYSHYSAVATGVQGISDKLLTTYSKSIMSDLIFFHIEKGLAMLLSIVLASRMLVVLSSSSLLHLRFMVPS